MKKLTTQEKLEVRQEENKEGFPPPPGTVIENFELSAQLQILNKLAEKA